jgi:hypothetical protein
MSPRLIFVAPLVNTFEAMCSPYRRQ